MAVDAVGWLLLAVPPSLALLGWMINDEFKAVKFAFWIFSFLTIVLNVGVAYQMVAQEILDSTADQLEPILGRYWQVIVILVVFLIFYFVIAMIQYTAEHGRTLMDDARRKRLL